VKSKKNQILIAVLVGVGFVALPLFVEGYWIRVISSIFMYAIITGALNIIAGFAGYAAFGNIVFFGIGSYTTAMLMLRVGAPWWSGVVVGAILAAFFAVLVGLPILRLRGHYFAIATLGINRAVEQIALDWGSFTGGGKGITLPLPQMEIQRFYAMIYFILFGLLLLTVLEGQGRAHDEVDDPADAERHEHDQSPEPAHGSSAVGVAEGPERHSDEDDHVEQRAEVLRELELRALEDRVEKIVEHGLPLSAAPSGEALSAILAEQTRQLPQGGPPDTELTPAPSSEKKRRARA
jgi:hypothetical protein